MITLAEAQRATGGQWLAQPLPLQTPLKGAAFDTRKLGDNQLFFALKGETADGHDHLAKLAGSAVRLAVVHRRVELPGYDGAVLLVEDTLKALAQLGRAVVEKYRPTVVAVTGSYGKTTAKELLAGVLEAAGPVLKTPGSLNNEIGLPVTLLQLDGSQKLAVLEFAARHEGDISYLGAIAPPDVAVWLNVGRAHIGVFGSQEAIYRAKSEILDHLRPGGLAVVGGEDPRMVELAQAKLKARPGCQLATFGRERGDFQAGGVSTDRLGRQSFTGSYLAHRLDFKLGLPGPHGLYPALAAWAVARHLGVADGQVAQRAGAYRGQPGRAVLDEGPGGAVLLDDTYNASPETVVNLVATLAQMEAKERVLVLGHLSELDGQEDEAMELIGAALRPPLSLVLSHDPTRPQTATQLALLAEEVEVEPHHHWPGLMERLAQLDRPGVVIGFKGSRSAHLERAVLGMKGRRVACHLERCPLLIGCGQCPKLERP